MTMIAIESWYLEFIEGASKKFYRVHLTEDGVVSTGWGRLHTSGQAQLQRLAPGDAKAIALRQVYAKAAKGYLMRVDDFRWEVSARTLDTSISRDNSQLIDIAYEEALVNPVYAADKAVVAKMYRIFTERAEALMQRASSGEDFEELLPEFQEVQRAFNEIGDMHSRAEVTMGLTNQMLMGKLMGTS